MIGAVAAVPGLVVRGFRGEDDFPAMLRVYTAAHEADGIEEVTTLDDLRRNYANLVNCDPARDILVAEVTGEVVATPASSGRSSWRAGARTRTSASSIRPGGGGGSAERCTA